MKEKLIKLREDLNNINQTCSELKSTELTLNRLNELVIEIKNTMKKQKNKITKSILLSIILLILTVLIPALSPLYLSMFVVPVILYSLGLNILYYKEIKRLANEYKSETEPIISERNETYESLNNIKLTLNIDIQNINNYILENFIDSINIVDYANEDDLLEQTRILSSIINDEDEKPLIRHRKNK